MSPLSGETLDGRGIKERDKKKSNIKEKLTKKVPPPLHEEEEEEEEDLFMDFEKFWEIVKDHGRVAPFYRTECEYLWKNYTPAQQQAICETIERKLQTGKFVHYNPALAMQDNLPRQPKTKILSADEYYRIHHTTENEDGWVRTFLPDQHKTIYIKQ